MEQFRSFSRYAAGESLVQRVDTPEDVFRAFNQAAGRRIVLRGGGHSFHDQALHDKDTGNQIVLLVDGFQGIEFEVDGNPDRVCVQAGVKWGDFLKRAIAHACERHQPLRIPGSMQTGRDASAGGTLAGNCLSRFSGLMGKESRSIESFRIIVPASNEVLNVSRTEYPELFRATVGGHGYIGFVTDATYIVHPISVDDVAHTTISIHDSFDDLVNEQLRLVQQSKRDLRALQAVSSVWYTDQILDLGHLRRIKGGVFHTRFAPPSKPPQPGFPLYADTNSPWRYAFELMARTEPANWIIHEFLYNLALHHKGDFENDLDNFLFFMDGNTIAKKHFEHSAGQLFPIVQQTFVVPQDRTVAFADKCEAKIRANGLRPTESDMLFVSADDCFMSANYQMDGFAVTFAFEPVEPSPEAPPRIVELLNELSRDCLAAGGRIHLTKDLYAEREVVRRMFYPQIEQFEAVKRQYDPKGILQNKFSDFLFDFS